MMKQCSTCQQVKPLTDYYIKQSNNKTYFYNTCKRCCCKIQYQKSNYQKRGSKLNRLNHEHKQLLQTAINNNNKQEFYSICADIGCLTNAYSWWKNRDRTLTKLNSQSAPRLSSS